LSIATGKMICGDLQGVNLTSYDAVKKSYNA